MSITTVIVKGHDQIATENTVLDWLDEFGTTCVYSTGALSTIVVTAAHPRHIATKLRLRRQCVGVDAQGKPGYAVYAVVATHCVIDATIDPREERFDDEAARAGFEAGTGIDEVFYTVDIDSTTRVIYDSDDMAAFMAQLADPKIFPHN